MSFHFRFGHALRLVAIAVAAVFVGGWSVDVVPPASAQQGAAVVQGQPARGGPPGDPRGGPPPSRPGQPPGGPGEGKPESGKAGEGDAKPDGGESPELKVIRRQDVDGQRSDAEELQATVGEDGRVAFQFRNQPWVDLVQWVADISGQPLDWQELPGDRVNLASPGRYTVEEARDLFNRHLLARGFAILEVDGGLTVVKTETVNPALVRRVDVHELARLPDYSFVRTLLDVGWLSAEKLAEELKPMISENGRLTALSTTNRIEAMDAAINLRQVAELLAQERDVASRDALAPEFRLRYIPAEEAKALLEQFLGVEKKDAAPMTPQQMQQMQQMQQRQQAQGGEPPEPKVEISIVANVRQNSVLVRAPIDRVAVAAEFIKRIDVQGESMRSLADVRSRVEVFRLASLDPEKLIEIVQEMNVLEPGTRLRADKDNQAVVVSGSAADRFIIGSLIERLDGSGRQFEVLQLRRLDAAEVAESIEFLMGKGQDKDDGQSNRRPYYYGMFGSREEPKKPQDDFRVAANARYNQVLLWANPTEMSEVRSLLVKLGELPPPGGSTRTVRVIDASATPETYEYLQTLRQQWESISDNPLELPEAERFKDPIAETKSSGGRDTDRPSASKESPAAPRRTSDDDDDAGADAGADAETDAENQDSPKNDQADGEGSDDVVRGDASRQTLTAQVENAGPGDATGRAMSGDAGGNTDDSRREVRSAQEFDARFGNAPQGGTDVGGADVGGSGENPTPGAGQTAGGFAGRADPVRITIDREGNLVISSSDTAALDRLENLMLQAKPPRRPYHVFQVRHATASWVTLNLEDYFKDLQESDDRGSDNFMRWYFGYDNRSSDDGPSGLGKGNRLRFVWDNDTNTIVVSGATTDQLRTIAELIELWDVREAVDQRRMRFTKIVPIRFSRAADIAETVKEAYRDLLSSKDKAFTGGGQGGQGGQGGGNANRGGGGRNRDGDGSGLTDQESGRDGGGSNFSFSGKLSIGVDEVGNTLVVSAEGESLLELVTGVIERLDKAARPSGEFEVLKLSGQLGAGSLARALGLIGAEVSGDNGGAGRGNGDTRRETDGARGAGRRPTSGPGQATGGAGQPPQAAAVGGAD